MQNRFRQKTMSLLLSGLVAVWGIVLSGVQHTHVGGTDPTHRHDKCHEVVRHDSHSHESDEGHHKYATDADLSLSADDVLHLHWQLLGVEFSMPVSDEPTDGDGEGSAVPVVVRVMNEEGMTTQAGPSFGRVLAAAACVPNVDLVRGSESEPRPPNLVTSIPLCDSARLERSGVLLA